MSEKNNAVTAADLVCGPVTPGPLVTMCLDTANGPQWEVVSDVPGEPVQHYAEIVAEMHGSPSGTDEALCLLFAAAPDLLDALAYMLEVAEFEGWSEMMLGDARAAIAKAKGAH